MVCDIFKREKNMIDSYVLLDLDKYIKSHFVKIEPIARDAKCCSKQAAPAKAKNSKEFCCASLLFDVVDDFIDLVKDKQTFSEYLFCLIDESGQTDANVYNKAGVDRRLFSKIRSNKDYQPSKNTVFALAMALELDYTKTSKLLRKAGFDFSNNKMTDIIIMFCIENKIYDMYEIDTLLEKYEQKPLASI